MHGAKIEVKILSEHEITSLNKHQLLTNENRKLDKMTDSYYLV